VVPRRDRWIIVLSNKPELVVVSPLPPTASGIADYTASLLPHLARRWTLNVLVADDDPEPDDPGTDARIFRARSWDDVQRLVAIDRILYCLGNSVYHIHVPGLCRRHGGVVLAHEIRMVALQCLLAAQSPDPHYLSALVGQAHGLHWKHEVESFENQAPLSQGFAAVRKRLEEGNAYLLRPSVTGADLVAVHSHLAARLARFELYGTRTDVTVVPFGYMTAFPKKRNPQPGLIGSFGMVEPEKDPFCLLDALSILRFQHPNIHLRLVGPLGGGMASALTRYARHLGVSDRLELTGRVSQQEYFSHLSSVSVAVQLRKVVNGETSAAVNDCLRFGIPTLVSGLGSARELPRSAVEHLSSHPSPEEVAAKLSQLIGDQARLASLSAGAVSLVERQSASAASDALSDVLMSAPPPRRLS